jgi:hypothetical protein
MIIDFEYEKLKRSDHQEVFVDLLDGFLDIFLSSDKEDREGLLTEFIEGLDLGPKSLTHLVHAYFKNTDVQFAVDNIIMRTPLNVIGNVVEFIEACWPQEKNLVKRFKVLLIGFSIKKFKAYDDFHCLEIIEEYLLGKDDMLELQIMSPIPNILTFPSHIQQFRGA